jgi:hypothetical protein
MKKLTALVLFACVCLCVGPVLADSPKARFKPKAPFNGADRSSHYQANRAGNRGRDRERRY